jgi:hypothetical protein
MSANEWCFDDQTIGLCIPLLAVVCPLSTSSGTLVARVTGDTESVSEGSMSRRMESCSSYPMAAVDEKDCKIC